MQMPPELSVSKEEQLNTEENVSDDIILMNS